MLLKHLANGAIEDFNMANIRPFKAWRYHPKQAQDIGNLIAPPFDVVSERQRTALYHHPYNSIHLSVPAGLHPEQAAANTIRRWQQEKILVQEDMPCLYTYYQYFKLPDSDRSYCRKGFICFIEATFWEENVVLRHEDTIPSSVNGRIALLEATQLNASPTHGLYTDPQHLLEALMDKSMEMPLYQAEDYQGVRDVLGVIRDEETIRHFMETMRNKQIILADGHHRYESSLAYRKKMMRQHKQHTGREGYNYHMMYLTNTESEDLRILPTHRLYHCGEPLDARAIMEKATRYFHIQQVENACDMQELIVGKKYTFGLLFGEESYKLRLKEALTNDAQWQATALVRQLDVAVLHYFLIEKVLDIPLAQQSASDLLTYERNFAQCIYQVATQRAQLAMIINGVSVNQVKEICYSGEIMPQKSTSFYPKAICGFVFGSITSDGL